MGAYALELSLCCLRLYLGTVLWCVPLTPCMQRSQLYASESEWSGVTGASQQQHCACTAAPRLLCGMQQFKYCRGRYRFRLELRCQPLQWPSTARACAAETIAAAARSCCHWACKSVLRSLSGDPQAFTAQAVPVHRPEDGLPLAFEQLSPAAGLYSLPQTRFSPEPAAHLGQRRLRQILGAWPGCVLASEQLPPSAGARTGSPGKPWLATERPVPAACFGSNSRHGGWGAGGTKHAAGTLPAALPPRAALHVRHQA